MNTSLKIALPWLIGLGALTGLARAQSQLPQVDITAPRATQIERLAPRADVSRVCPGYAATLSTQLMLPAVETPTEHIVRFTLVDGKVDQVRVRHAPQSYRRQVGAAMAQVACVDDRDMQQNFAFILRVVPEGSQESSIAEIKDSKLLAALAAE